MTYRLHLVVVGDIAAHVAAGTALRDLVREANRGRQTWSVAEVGELTARLRSRVEESPRDGTCPR